MIIIDSDRVSGISGIKEESKSALVKSNIANELKQDRKIVKRVLPIKDASTLEHGYNISKSYYFKCDNETGCGAIFIKLMIVELSHCEAESLSKYKVQQLFNTSQNAQAPCPYCKRKVGLILKSNLMIGGIKQLDYSLIKRNYDDDIKIEISECDTDRAFAVSDKRVLTPERSHHFNEHISNIMAEHIKTPKVLSSYKQRLKGQFKWDA